MHVKERSPYTKQCIVACKGERLCVNECIDACKGEEPMCK